MNNPFDGATIDEESPSGLVTAAEDDTGSQTRTATLLQKEAGKTEQPEDAPLVVTKDPSVDVESFKMNADVKKSAASTNLPPEATTPRNQHAKFLLLLENFRLNTYRHVHVQHGGSCH